MKKLVGLIIVVIIVTFSSCDKNSERTSILGGWTCEEFSDISASRTYSVSIVRYEVDPTYYKIYNFHNLGESEGSIVLCYEGEDGKLYIDRQIVSSTSAVISDGVGVIADDFSTISWTYTYSDGSSSEGTIYATYY